MQAASTQNTGRPTVNPLLLEQVGPVAVPHTSRTISLLVSEAEYQRLRGMRRQTSAGRGEPIDRRLAELLDACY